MPVPPIPIQRYLVPADQPALPAGFTRVDERIVDGLPHTIPLDATTNVIVIVPTGLAATWRDAEPTAIVSTSVTDLAPVTGPPTAPLGDVSRAPARLLVRRNRTTEASVPLAAGLRRFAPDAGEEDRGVAFELIVLEWDLRAGNLRGAGDFGSRIVFGWRRADRGVERYGPLPLNPHVVRRLRLEPLPPNIPPRRRWQIALIESAVGVAFEIAPPKFQIKQAVKVVPR
jgi:hypothetical protein